MLWLGMCCRGSLRWKLWIMTPVTLMNENAARVAHHPHQFTILPGLWYDFFRSNTVLFLRYFLDFKPPDLLVFCGLSQCLSPDFLWLRNCLTHYEWSCAKSSRAEILKSSMNHKSTEVRRGGWKLTSVEFSPHTIPNNGNVSSDVKRDPLNLVPG